jgi:hypothetical protein
MRWPVLVLVFAAAPLFGCGPVITLHHRSAPDGNCQADPGAGAGPALLDVASGAGYLGLLAANAPIGVTVESARVFVDDDGAPIAGMPTEDLSRYSPTGAFVSGEQRLVPVWLLTTAEADVLSLGPIGADLLDADDRVSVNVTTQVSGGSYSSNPLTLEMQLCRGCLVGGCALGERPTDVCFYGQDEGGSCAQN